MFDRLVVMASGWTKPDFLWVPMAQRFRKYGFDSIRVGYKLRGFGPIEESALSTAELLAKVAPYYEHVTFIGHSMGGLVGRYMIQELNVPTINAYVSLGTPHLGSRLAYLAPWSRSAVQMRPGSAFLEGLNAREWPTEVPALGIQGQFEEIVLPRSNANINFGLNSTIPRANHGSLPVHERTFQEIFGWMLYECFDGKLITAHTGTASKVDLAPTS